MEIVTGPAHHPAVSEQTKRIFRAAHPLAVQTLLEIMAHGENRDRLKAAAILLERADPVQTSHSINVTHQHISPEDELFEEFVAMVKLGVKFEKMREIFGGNRLPLLEQRYAEEMKTIEGKVEDGPAT